MPRNPFQYGSPVDAEHFAGRASEVAALRTRMADGINVVLISPRRYGKTSLLFRAEDSLRGSGAAVVHLDMLLCTSPADLAAKLAGAAFRVRSARWQRARDAVLEFTHRLRVSPVVTVGADGSPRFSFAGDLAGRDAHHVLEDVYALLADEPPRRPAVLVFDEFQAVTELDQGLPGVLKALSDQYGRVSLVLAGSQRHLMERLTGSKGAPLYGMAERLGLGPVGTEEMAEYLCRQATSGNRPMAPDVAMKVIEMAGPVPNDIQRLAYAAYEAAGRRIGPAEVDLGMQGNVSRGSSFYAVSYQGFSVGQRRVLQALAAEPEAKIFSASFARLVGLANAASVRKAIEALSSAEAVARTGTGWRVADPFFAYWLRWAAQEGHRP